MRTPLIAIISLGLTCGAAQAQTLYGPGGLIINPTAYTDPEGYFEVNSSFFNRQTAGTTTSLYPTSLTYALSDRFEVGGIYLGERSGSSTFDQGGLYFKEGLLDESPRRPALSVVGTSFTGQGTTSTITLVGSKDLYRGFRLHLGARFVSYSDFPGADGNVIAGFDKALSKSFRVMAEADSRLEVYHYGSTAFGIQYMGPVVVTVGAVDQASGRLSFFVGVGYPVGKT